MVPSKEVRAGTRYRADWTSFRYTTTWRARWARFVFSVRLWRRAKPDRDGSRGAQVEVLSTCGQDGAVLGVVRWLGRGQVASYYGFTSWRSRSWKTGYPR